MKKATFFSAITVLLILSCNLSAVVKYDEGKVDDKRHSASAG